MTATPNITALAAGRDLDALVAEKVMGWIIERRPMRLIIRPPPGAPIFSTEVSPGAAHDDVTLAPWWQFANGLPAYSTDIAAAWEVVEKLQACRPRIEKWGLYGWRVMLNVNADRVEDVNATGETAPLAICRAALKAVDAP